MRSLTSDVITSLVRELRSHTLPGEAKKTNFTKTDHTDSDTTDRLN